MRLRSAMVVAVASSLLAELLFLQGSMTDRAAAEPATVAGPVGGQTGDQHGSHRITLITGDVVELSVPSDGSSRAIVVDDVGPRGIEVRHFDGRVSAVPYEVAGLVASGRLDRRLFDLSGLVENGYDDRHSDVLPVIAEYPDQRLTRSSILPPGAMMSRRFDVASAVAMRVSKSRAAAFWSGLAPDLEATTGVAELSMGVRRLWLDGKVQASLDVSVPYVGAPAPWAAGFDGRGSTVAVLDTGVDASHPDLVGKVLKAQNFTDAVDTADRNGHGTHVASTIAGTGAASRGARKRVAPGARLLIGKVLADNGSGDFSWVMAGMEWAVEQGADIVNMSLGACCGDGSDMVSQLLNRLSETTGTLFVVAAGNRGPDREQITFPGAAARALTIGATGRGDDVVAEFSGRGPVGARIKPDLSAPGTSIVAARAAGTLNDEAVDAHYARLSGTSMATPHVAGAAAVLAQRHPDWTGERLKTTLMSTAETRGSTNDAYEIGSGRLDVRRAILQGVHATGPLEFGVFEWPHDPGEQISKTITYTNTTNAPVTLDLRATAWATTDPTRTPTNALSVSPAVVTVPAGARSNATATLRVPDSGYGLFGGWITARTSDGAVTVRNSVGWNKREQHFSVDITATDRSGRPPLSGSFVLQDLERDRAYEAWFDDHGRAYFPSLNGYTPQLPRGLYMLTGHLHVDGVDGRPSDLVSLVVPEIKLDRPYRADLSARKAVPIRFRAPRPTDNYGRFSVEFERRIGEHRYKVELGTFRDTLDFSGPPLFVTPTARVTAGTFTATFAARHNGPPLRAELRGNGRPIVVEARYPTCEGFCWSHRAIPRIDGAVGLRLVDAGSGTAEELRQARVRGRAALIRSTDEQLVDQLAKAAQDAGAAAVVLWNPDGPPAHRVTDIARLNLPVMWVPSSAGSAMRRHAHKRGMLRLSGRQPTPYFYDGRAVVHGRIPSSLRFDIRTHQVATVHRELRHPAGVGVPTDPRATCPEWARLPSWLSHSCDESPRTLTHYAIPGFLYENVHLAGRSTGGSSYRPRERRYERLLAAPFAPGAVDAARDEFDRPASRRAAEGTITFSPGVSFTEAEPGRWAGVGDNEATHRLRAFADGRLIGDVAATDLAVIAEPRGRDYRLEYDFSLNRTPWTGTTQSRSVWTFRSAQVSRDTALAQLQVRYDLTLDEYNRAQAGRSMPFRFQVDHQPAYRGKERIVAAALEVSYDNGRAWQGVRVRRTSTGWIGYMVHPPLGRTSGSVSVRVRANDSAGNTIDQTLVSAYRLR